jgi:hypothetical protein
MPPLTEHIELVERLPDESGGYGDSFNRDYESHYYVVTTSESVGPIRVEFAPGIPRVGSQYVALDGTFDPLARCRKVTPRRAADNICEWVVTCEFSTQSPVGIGSDPTGVTQRPASEGGNDDPTQWLPKRRWDSRDVTLVLRKDLDNKYAVNTVGDFFDPLPTYQSAVKVLMIERIESTFDAEEMADFDFAMNQQAFLWAEPKQAQMLPITAEEAWIGNSLYWRVRYAIQFMKDWPFTWESYTLNAGLRAKHPPTGRVDSILAGASAQPVTTPVPLWRAGVNRVGEVMSPSEIASEGPSWVVLRPYRLKNFSDLNLPLAGL